MQLHIWDTAGQERYRTITQSYYRNAHGVILAFDLTRERTFTNISRWMDDIKQYCGMYNGVIKCTLTIGFIYVSIHTQHHAHTIICFIVHIQYMDL